ncbi:MAG: hypothetical protein KDE08_03135 [Rhodobacteraceae bacterium]|nr:hypothetical protein [Paracoccaceae bacterium]
MVIKEIEQLGEVRPEALAMLISNWEVAESVELKLPNLSEAQRQALIDLIPEIMMAQLLLQHPKWSYRNVITFLVRGQKAPDFTLPLTSLRLCSCVRHAMEIAQLGGSDISKIVASSALADSVSKALKQGSRLEGASIVVTLIGVLHDGQRLVRAN